MRAGDDLLVELTVPVPEAELAADRLWTAGATAVEVREGDPPGRTTLSASMPTDAAARRVAAELDATVVAPDPSWRDAWRQWATPIEVGNRLVIAPAWRSVELAGGREVVRIDPGACFGSGSHPSTRMVLAEMERQPPEGQTVIDVGCGSGILAVAAARLGATAVTAADVDPEAIEVTAANAVANEVEGVVTVTERAVERLVGPFDWALVNVTAAVHASVGSSVASLVARGGTITIAGLLPGQWRHVAGAYTGTTVVRSLELEGWEGVVLRA